MTIKTWIPGETLTEFAVTETDFPSTDLITTALGLKSTVPREAPSITALFDADESEASIMSVVPQPITSVAISPVNTQVDFRRNVFMTYSKMQGCSSMIDYLSIAALTVVVYSTAVKLRAVAGGPVLIR